MRILLIISVIFSFFAQPALANTTRGNDSDLSLSTAILGQWIAKNETEAFTLTSIIEYFEDGTVRMDSTLSLLRTNIKIQVKGKWEISKNRLVLIVTGSSHPEILKEGDVTVDEIITITPEKMVLIDSKGRKLIRERVKIARDNGASL
jgi:hypothetical protein